MTATPETLSKAEFAAHLNVSPSRLSHWIADGLIGPEALAGEGRKARIRVDVAVAQIRARRDVGQALGNGGTVRLTRAASPPMPEAVPAREASPVLEGLPLAQPPPVPVASAPTLPAAPDWLDPVEARIKQEKLDEIARRNRIAAAKEAADAGRYIEAAAARREMGLIASGMLQVLEQALDTFATAIAARFQVPQRDAVHLLKAEFRTVRERAAEMLARQAAALPRTVADREDPAEAADPEPDDAAAARPAGAPAP